MPTLKEIRAEYQAIARNSGKSRRQRKLRELALKKAAALRAARHRTARDDRPGYWMHETSGVLRPVVEAYLAGDPLTTMQIATMRAYLRQWIAAPAWKGSAEIVALRARIEGLTDRAAIDRWLDDAEVLGIDPL